MKSTPPAERLEFLELLRFVLAFGVVVYHYYFWAPHEHLIAYAPADGLGLKYLLLSVETFFAVSGFVIVLSAVNRRPVEFLIARFARLAPTLLIASTATLIAYYTLGVKPRIPGAALEYLSSVTLLPLASLGGLDWSLWSLKFELRFYLLIFLCLYFCNVSNNAFRIAVGILVYDAFTLILQLLGHPLAPHWLFFREYAPFFALGMLIYDRYLKGTTSTTWWLALAAAMALTSVRATQELERVYDLSLHLGHIGLLQGVCIAFAILLLLILCARSTAQPLLAVVFRVAGRGSYPLYVFHQLCGYWVLNFCTAQLHLRFDFRPLLLVAMSAVSLLFGNLLEPRLIRLYKRVLQDALAVLSFARPPRMPVAPSRAGTFSR